MNGLTETRTATAAKPSRPAERLDRPKCWRCQCPTRIADGEVICTGCPIPFRLTFDLPRSANCHE